jgi:hypothetical protein
MLSLVIASSILALIFLAAAVVEQVCRWFLTHNARRRIRQEASAAFKAEHGFGLLAEPNRIPTH